MTDSNIELQIEQIKVYMDLNIPGKENKQIPLTSSLLYNPLIKSSSNFSEYPFFTKDIVYPKAVLNRLEFNDRIDFFFNKDKFKKIIMKHRSNYFPEKLKMDFSDFEDSDVIIAYNIEAMIELLFPITEPIINNHQNSFSKYIQERTDNSLSFKGSTAFLKKITPSLDIFPGLDSYYSYLKIDGKVYTVTKVTWLNDIINHPLYRKLINEYKIFNSWRKGIKIQIETDIEKRTDKLFDIIKSTLNIDIIIKENEDFLKEQTDSDKHNNIEIMKKSIKNLFEGSQKTKIDVDKYIDKIANIVEKINQILSISEARYKINITNNMKNVIKKISDEVGKIVIFKKINKKYFESTSINLSFEDDEPEVQKEFSSTYSNYTNFINKIKDFIKPKKETMNAGLQRMIYDYTQRYSDVFGDYINYVNEFYLKDNSNVEYPKLIDKKDKLYFSKIAVGAKSTYPFYIGIGYTELESPRYEIYIKVDVIGGELTKDSNIFCKYKGEYLGSLLEKIRYKKSYKKWETDNERFYFDVNDIIEKDYKKTSTSVPSTIKRPPAIKGGKRKKNNTKKNMIKLRRRTRRYHK